MEKSSSGVQDVLETTTAGLSLRKPGRIVSSSNGSPTDGKEDEGVYRLISVKSVESDDGSALSTDNNEFSRRKSWKGRKLMGKPGKD
jgi:hypothetical protein